MSKENKGRVDPDMENATAALIRAAKRARQLAAQARTEYVVVATVNWSARFLSLKKRIRQFNATEIKNMTRSMCLISIVYLVITGQFFLLAPTVAEEADEEQSAKLEPEFSSVREKKLFRRKNLDMKSLRRLECEMVCNNCAACLMSIKRTIDKVDGVFEVAINLKKPYRLIVVYDSTKSSAEKIMDAAKKDKKNKVKLQEKSDKPLSEHN